MLNIMLIYISASTKSFNIGMKCKMCILNNVDSYTSGQKKTVANSFALKKNFIITRIRFSVFRDGCHCIMPRQNIRCKYKYKEHYVRVLFYRVKASLLLAFGQMMAGWHGTVVE